MFDKLFLGILKSKWTWIAFAIVAGVIYVNGVIQDNRALRAENETRRQNQIAVQDSLNNMMDSVQVLVVSVRSLQSDATEWKGKYIAVSALYQISIDTIKVLRQFAHSQIIGDSVGIVSFDGTQGIASYNGRTEINMRSGESNYSLALAFGEIDARASLYYDETDKLWKMQTVSLSPGIKLRGISTVDDEIFRKMQGLKQINDKKPSTIAIGGIVAPDRVYGGIVIAPSQWMFSIEYKLFDKVGTTNESWSDKIAIGVHYFIW